MDQIGQENFYTPQMLEEIPVGIALLDARNFHIITANRLFRTLFNNSVMERKQDENHHETPPWQDFFTAPSFPFALELFQTVIQTGQAYQGQEFPVLHPERGLTYWNGSITPLYDSNRQLERLLITASEVTGQVMARLQAESRLPEQSIDTEIHRLAAMETVARSVSREMVREDIARVACDALAATLHPICIYLHFASSGNQELHLAHHYIDEDDRIAEHLHQVAAGLQTISYQSEHWIARARHAHEPILIPDLRDIPGIPGKLTSSLLNNGGYIYIPLWFKDHFEGTLVVLFRETLTTHSLLVRILKDCSTCISAALAHSRLLNDIESERARLYAILEHLPEGVFLVEAASHNISYANEAAAHILDLPRQALLNISLEHTYSRARDRFSLEHAGREFERTEIPLLRALAGETVLGEEVVFSKPGGKPLTLLVAAAPIRNTTGTITGAVTIFQDITQRKSVEQQKNEFLSIASHELRTPTTAIQGFAEILQMFAAQRHEPTAPHTEQIIADILKQSKRLTQLIDEILDIALIEDRQLVIHPARHDLVATIHQAVEQIAASEPQHSITLAFQGLPPDEPLYVFFDQKRMLQVLTYLLGNALKYSQPGHAVEIGLSLANQKPGRVQIWVRDAGIGIPADDLPYIFKRFHRAENFDRSISGLGIGLYLAREIVLSHNGTIRAESQEGRGSTFFVELPLEAQGPPKQTTESIQL